mgnify:CR=1 FL=1
MAAGGVSNKFFSSLFFPGGEVSVAVFFIIMGFFSFKRIRLKLQRYLFKQSIAQLYLLDYSDGVDYGNEYRFCNTAKFNS